MRLQLLLLCGVALALPAATLTVCASGCAYTNPQTAINAAVRGDIIELKAGEIFEGAYQLPYKSGTGYITIRTSRWRELPPQGTRITTADLPVMATMQPPDPSSPVLQAGYDETYPSSVSLVNDTINYGSAHGFANGDPIACWNDDGSIPIVENKVYYVRNRTSTTFNLSATPDGAIVDLQTPVTATRFRCTLARPASHWRIQGIELRKKPGQVTLYNLVQIGSGQETAREGIVHHIEFDHVYIHGVQEEDGPRICLVFNVAYSSITDSRIEHCIKQGEESKGIGGWQAPGPVLIRNNYIAAGSINILYGGDYVRIEGLVNGDNGGFRIEGNHFARPLWTKYTAGTGGTAPPTGACSTYSQYLNVSNGQWYICLGGAWTTAPLCAEGEYFRRTNVTQNCPSGACWKCASGVFVPSTVFRGASYNIKNLLELKSMINAIVAGNVFENNWGDAQSGIAVWVVSQVAQGNANGWVRGEDIRFERNIIRNSSQGIRLGSEGNTTFGHRNTRVQIRDNLMYKIGTTDYPSFSYDDSRPISFSGFCDDCLFDHNTVISNTTGGSGLTFDTNPLARFRLTNSITYGNRYGLQYDGGVGCGVYLPSPSILQNTVVINLDASTWTDPNCAANLRGVANNTQMFNGSGDYRLRTTSPYSASCTTGCDFVGTDGKDLGADVDLVDAATSGSTAGRAVASRFGLQTDTGSRHAILRYQAPDAASCSVRLYTNAGRSVLHADTLTSGTQLDSRAGNLASGLRREFVLGSVSLLTANTTYYGLLDCSAKRTPFTFRTAAAGAGAAQEFRLGQASMAQYASDAAFTSPTVLGAATRHLIPVSGSSVVYVRIGNGPATAIAGR